MRWLKGGGESTSLRGNLKLIKGYKGMIVFKRHLLNNVYFLNAWMAVGEQPMTKKTHVKYDQFTRRINELVKKEADAQLELMKKHCHLDEKGEPKKVYSEDGRHTGFDWIDEAKANEEFKEHALEDIVIEGISPLFAVELDHMKLNNKQWAAIAPFIADESNLQKKD